MSQYTYWLRPLPAAEFAEKLCKVAGHIGGPHKVQIVVHTNIGNLSAGHTGPDTLAEAAKAMIEKFNQYPATEISTAFLNYEGGARLRYTYDEKGARFHIESEGIPIEPENVLGGLSANFPIQRKSEMAPEGFPPEQLQAFKFVQDTQLKFSAEAARLSQLGAEETRKFLETTRATTEGLEKEYQDRKKKLDEEIAAERKKLEDERRAYNQTVESYELRENTAIRRELLEEILQRHEQQKEFAYSKHTTATRLGVVYAIFSLVAGAISVGGLFAFKISRTESTADWHNYVGLAVSFGVFVTSLIYYARWNDRYFRDHADAEIANKKFANDIMRASWIAELYIEARKGNAPELPVELLKSFTNQLFVPSFTGEDTKHPYEQVADTLKGITKIKANKDGIELEGTKR